MNGLSIIFALGKFAKPEITFNQYFTRFCFGWLGITILYCDFEVMFTKIFYRIKKLEEEK